VGFFCISVFLLLRPQALAQESRDVLSVDVELVNVTASVIDEFGRSLQGLTAQDFQVIENGNEQKISFFSYDSSVPISIGVLIDVSGSLQDKLRQGLQTAREIVSTLTSDDEMFVIMFNSRIEVRQKFTTNPEEIQRSLGHIDAGGETALYDAIAVGLREMQTAKHQKRIMLLISDGFDTKSKINSDHAQDLLKRSHVLLYAIGIDDDDNNPPRRRAKYHIYDYMLGKLTNAGGGRLIRLYTGRTYDGRWLSEMFLGELHQAYTLGYYPSTVVDNTGWRNIEVRVTKPGARIVGVNNKQYKGGIRPVLSAPYQQRPTNPQEQ